MGKRRQFPCPRCGGITHVAETRPNVSGLRRRRHCANPACDGRLTTQEIAIRVDENGKKRRIDDNYVLISRARWERLSFLVQDILDNSISSATDPAWADDAVAEFVEFDGINDGDGDATAARGRAP